MNHLQRVHIPTINVQQAERWTSALAGAACLVAGVKRLADQRAGQAAVLSALGAGLLWRGSTGHCGLYAMTGINTAEQGDDTRIRLAGSRGVKVEQTVSIAVAREKLYNAWQRLDRMPEFVPHLLSVDAVDDRTSEWLAAGPGGLRLQWTAEIINDVPGELIAWRTVGGADVVSAGSVHFSSERGGRGTIVKVILQYDAPGGAIGRALAKIFGAEPSQVVHDGLRRFKQLMEAGEIATTDGQSRGGR